MQLDSKDTDSQTHSVQQAHNFGGGGFLRSRRLTFSSKFLKCLFSWTVVKPFMVFSMRNYVKLLVVTGESIDLSTYWSISLKVALLFLSLRNIIARISS